LVDSRRTETLFLDAGGVLVFPNWQRVSDTLAAYGITVTPQQLIEAEPQAKFAIDQSVRTGTPDSHRAWQYMELVLETAGIPTSDGVYAAVRDLKAYHGRYNLWEFVPDDVVPALERLAASPLKLVVVSNANGVLHACFDRLRLSRYFDRICDSFVEGVEKPDPRFFQIALARAGADARTTTHVGDLYHVDIVGARNAGLGAILIDPHDLYRDYDAERVRTLDELTDRFVQGGQVPRT
jgi:putative hydrolase of the HAD superfamily